MLSVGRSKKREKNFFTSLDSNEAAILCSALNPKVWEMNRNSKWPLLSYHGYLTDYLLMYSHDNNDDYSFSHSHYFPQCDSDYDNNKNNNNNDSNKNNNKTRFYFSPFNPMSSSCTLYILHFDCKICKRVAEAQRVLYFLLPTR